MFRFEHTLYLWLLALIPLMVFMVFSAIKKRENIFSKWGNESIMKSLVKGYDDSKAKLRYGLWMLAFLFAFTGMSNPQWGFESEALKTNGTDVYVAIDISKSMDANDIAPTRMIRAKKYAIDLIQKLKGNNIGLILFAGSAYMQIPLTSDYAAAVMMVNASNTDQAGTQGTNINAVADLINRASEKQPNPPSHLILITDGEDHEGDAIEAVKNLAANGTATYCIGVGTTEGGNIPEGNGFKLDDNQLPVLTRLNASLVNDIAKNGNGRAFGVEDENSINVIFDDLANAKKSEKTSRSFNQYNSFFQIFLFLSLCLLALEYMFSKWYYLKKQV
jgi:Ca-activated chloride channel homolog